MSKGTNNAAGYTQDAPEVPLPSWATSADEWYFERPVSTWQRAVRFAFSDDIAVSALQYTDADGSNVRLGDIEVAAFGEFYSTDQNGEVSKVGSLLMAAAAYLPIANRLSGKEPPELEALEDGALVRPGADAEGHRAIAEKFKIPRWAATVSDWEADLDGAHNRYALGVNHKMEPHSEVPGWEPVEAVVHAQVTQDTQSPDEDATNVEVEFIQGSDRGRWGCNLTPESARSLAHALLEVADEIDEPLRH